MGEYHAMRKGGAVTNPVFHLVEESLTRTREEALCGVKPKTIWVDCGQADQVTCGKCRARFSSHHHGQAE